MMSKGRRFNTRDEGISSVIGAIMITGIVFALLLTVRISFVPVWEEKAEAAHLVGVEKQLSTIKAEIDRQVDDPTTGTLSNPITLAQDRASIFQSAPPVHRVEINTSGHALRLDANQALILSNNGVAITGLNPQWLPVPGAPVTGVTTVQALRIRITLNSNAVGQSVNLSVTDRNSDLVGFVIVEVTRDPPEALVTTTSYQAPNTVLAGVTEGAHQKILYEYFTDVLDPSLLFDQVLASAETPLSFTFTKSDPAFQADYVMTYGTDASGGSALVGTGAGLLKLPYVATYSGGSLVYKASSAYHVPQTYILENGALILAQDDGAVFKIPPSFSVSRSATLVSLGMTVPSLSGSAQSLSGASNVKITTTGSGNNDINALMPRLQLTLTTDYPTLWRDFWDEQFAAAGLSSTATATSTAQYTVSASGNQASFALFGPTADQGSVVYDLSIHLQQATIGIGLES
jgi:hypothetical protein